ncbi:hypothetical protein PENARI_c030G12056 [Penicillium arizonense]|uniref:Uncharacterized protein n=1 Tax=Penicillium arizonense TaxID=1835702 RepID=A0A1F5L5K3_PENAI|nr:hypothetical protein PENARI_c030G12056 [Penicillium arizonense]OGE48260.1 hypothetical protein PENARI_c030G12056 [Penicillium arizonense]
MYLGASAERKLKRAKAPATYQNGQNEYKHDGPSFWGALSFGPSGPGGLIASLSALYLFCQFRLYVIKAVMAQLTLLTADCRVGMFSTCHALINGSDLMMLAAPFAAAHSII